MAPIKVTTPEGEVKELGPEDTSPHRFADFGGEVISPSDPPTMTEAAQKLWGAFFRLPADDEGPMPTKEEIEAEHERMMDLYRQGTFERP